jgi:hypothetical protein
VAETDPDGYTRNSPVSIQFMVVDWEDCLNKWNPLDQQDFTEKIFVAYQTQHGANYIKTHPGYDPSNDPMMQDKRGVNFLRNLMQMNYQDRVTGKNLEELSTGKDGVRETIRKKLSEIGDTVETDRTPDYNIALTTVGEYWGQLASLVPGVPLAYKPDPNGDVLRLKYITHGNVVTFGAALNFGGQVLFGVIDPFSAVTSDEASFWVTFDTTATVDLRLPHNYRETLQVLSAVVHLSGATLYPGNYTATYVIDAARGAIENGVNGYKKDFTQDLQGSLQDVDSLISDGVRMGFLTAFDQAEYSVDASDPTNPTLIAKFIQHPSREYDVHVDRLEGQFSRGPVQNYVTVQIGKGEPATEVIEAPFYNYQSVVRTYAPTAPPEPTFGDGSRTVVIQLDVLRRIVQKKVRGQFKNEGGDWHVIYEDGVDIDLGPNFNPNDPMAKQLLVRFDRPLPGIKQGLLETNEIFVDYATQYVYGRYPDNSIYKVKATAVAAQPPMSAYAAGVSIPGTKDIPQVQFTITMSGTRNGTPCNEMPLDPPRRVAGEHRAAVPAQPTEIPTH